MRPLILTSLVLVSMASATPTLAGDADLFRMINLGQRVIGEVSRQQARADAMERRRIEREDEEDRIAALKQSSAGRRLLAREEAQRREEAKKRAALWQKIWHGSGDYKSGTSSAAEDNAVRERERQSREAIMAAEHMKRARTENPW